ncbi:MAG: hypothetical protein DWI00_12360 [Planctomycetota bacterium]|nr:MAG: hypothetical protein DWI00_12360 [Planctomycetota bacterium]
MTFLKRGLSAFEAIINGMFGCLLCVMLALMPILSLERQLPWFPAGNESVSIILLACLTLEGVEHLANPHDRP